MRVLIAGAGPAGLYAAILLRQRRADAEIIVVEQNGADATFGFGVVFSDQALSFLAGDDPDTARLFEPHLERWRDIMLVHGGERITIDGVGFAAIGRLALLQLLRGRARELGIVPRFGHTLADADDLAGVDLVIAADGANSWVRSLHATEFGTTITPLTNRFAWFGTTTTFETLTQTFITSPQGAFNAHHYRYAPDRSTFIVETNAATCERLGLDTMAEDASRQLCEAVFADTLGGHGLISNRSIWRRFPCIRNVRWHHRNVVLVGDALRTAHFSIGSGTRLALEDVVALLKALDGASWRIDAALAAYEAARRPVVDKLVAAADASAAWYENFEHHLRLAPWPFAMSYIRRSGRLDPARLAQLSPRFAAAGRAAGVTL